MYFLRLTEIIESSKTWLDKTTWTLIKLARAEKKYLDDQIEAKTLPKPQREQEEL